MFGLVRLLVLLIGLIIMAIPYSILLDVYGLGMVLLTIIIVWPGMYFIIYVLHPYNL